METLNRAFGKVLRTRRKNLKLTQEQLAFEADLQRVYISLLELGRQQPSLVTVFKLAEGLNCSPAVLIDETEKMLRQFENT